MKLAVLAISATAILLSSQPVAAEPYPPPDPSGFVSALRVQGIAFADQNYIQSVGWAVCDASQRGMTHAAVNQAVKASHYTDEEADHIIDKAVLFLCPSQMLAMTAR